MMQIEILIIGIVIGFLASSLFIIRWLYRMISDLKSRLIEDLDDIEIEKRIEEIFKK